MDPREFAAIDPIALILRGKALDIYWLIHHPHVPPIDELQQALRSATQEERQATLARAKTMVAYGTAVQKAIETMPAKAASA
jgi:hypothetical protein